MTLRGGGGSRLSVIMTLTVGNMICESPLRNGKIKANRASETEVLKKERLRIERE